MEYKVYYTERDDTDLDYKADLFTEQNKPNEPDVKCLTFVADSDKVAKEKVLGLIFPNDKRPVRGVGKLRECRPKGKVGNLKVPSLLDLNSIKEPLKTKLFDALYPLIENGDLIDEEFVLRPKNRDDLIIPVRAKKKKETSSQNPNVAGETIPVNDGEHLGVEEGPVQSATA